MKIKTFLLVICCTIGIRTFSQSIDGYWEGSLSLPGNATLRVGIFVSQTDTLHVEMDSPDQYVTGILPKSASFQDSVLSLEVPSLHATFTGKLTAEGVIAGTFKQGSKLPLTLKRGQERLVISRPQTPQAPFPYQTEELVFRSRDGKYNLISGTLTYPTDKRPTELYILISGSGWQDRDENIYEHRPFAVIADYLTRHKDAAVFRYDDFPTFLFSKSTTLDFADGVRLILDSLSARPELAGLPVTLIGHSEGSVVAFIVGAQDTRISKIITLGGVAQSIREVLNYQIRAIAEAEGTLTIEEINRTAAISDKLYKTVEKAKDREMAAKKVSKTFDKEAAKLTAEEQQRYNMTPTNKLRVLQELTSPWFFTFFHLKPQDYISRLRCPVLAINGAKDLQVEAEANQRLMRQYLPADQKFTPYIVPNANHLLQPCTTGSSSEYGQIETTILPEVLQRIAEF